MKMSHGRSRAAFLLMALSFLPGCASDGGGGGGSSGTTGGGLGAAVADYDAGRFDEAHTKSMAAMRDAAGAGNAQSRDQSAYLAGLSAFRMRQFDEAEMRLLTAAQSSDPIIQGRSKSLLGLIRLEQNRPAAAAEYFEEAAVLLADNERAEAAYQAAAAHRAAGNLAAAQRLASGPGTSAYASNVSSGSGTGSGTFAIQVGAFENLANAQSAADDARRLASQNQLGDVRIIPRRDSRSRTLYVVQFGSFASRTQAEDARRRVGRMNYIVAPLSRGT